MPAPAIVLTAHDIFVGAPPLSGCEANISASVDLLEQSLRAIRGLGYSFVDFATFMAERRKGGVALLTFDDAYISINHNAFPMLSAEGIPAVVFVVTGALQGAGDPFPLWFQELRDKRDEFRSGAATSIVLTHPLVRRTVEKSGAPTLFDLLSKPLGASTEAFRTALDQSELDQLAVLVAGVPGLRRVTMTEAELRGLLGSIEFGAHSVTHRSFAHLSSEEIESEVTQSTAGIAVLCGKPMAEIPFAYPYGAVTAHAERVVTLTCRAGFTCQSRPLSGLDRASLLPRINLDLGAIGQVNAGGPIACAVACVRERLMLKVRASPMWKMLRSGRGLGRRIARH